MEAVLEEINREVEEDRDTLATIAEEVGSEKSEKITMEERDAELSQVRLIVAVADRATLARVIRRLRTITSVLRVTRVRH